MENMTMQLKKEWGVGKNRGEESLTKGGEKGKSTG